MKKAQFITVLSAGLFGIAALFTACQKNSNSPSSGDNVSAQDQLTLQASATADDASDNAYNDVFTNAMGADADAGLGAGIGVFLAAPGNAGTPVSSFGAGVDSVGHCYTVTVDPQTAGVFPKTVTINFGTGCTGKDGHIRRGKVIAVYTGRMRTAGSTATVTLDGFYIDSVKVEGTMKVENNSTAAGLAFTVTITNGKLTSPSGDYVAVDRTHTWTQTAGSDTPLNPADDVYNVTGSSSGTASVSGIVFQWTTEITKPVVRKMSCRWRVSGQVTVTRNSKTAVIDYGNGDCDNQATVTIGSKVFNITLH